MYDLVDATGATTNMQVDGISLGLIGTIVGVSRIMDRQTTSSKVGELQSMYRKGIINCYL